MLLLRKFDPEKFHRRSIRLKGYDYSKPGAYFITLCVVDRNDFFGTIENGCMMNNEFSRIVEYTWNDLPNHNPHISLDVHVIMPDHFHGIIIIRDFPVVTGSCSGVIPAGAGSVVVGAGSEPAPTGTTTTIQPALTGTAQLSTKHHGLPEIVRQFKTFSARRINELRKTPGIRVWQRNYYEHIIRSGNEIDRIRRYIRTNPERYVRNEQ